MIAALDTGVIVNGKTPISHKQMKNQLNHWKSLVLIMLTMSSIGQADSSELSSPSFNRDIRPILASNCYSCHGPDSSSRKADLRLDTFAEATRDLGGYAAVTPGNPQSSEIIKRIQSQDHEEIMPPLETGMKVTPAQLAQLSLWIQNGAEYQTHWSFTPLQKPGLPTINQELWPKNGIDYFIGSELERIGLAPNPEADRYALARRLFLDITGLPPTFEEAEAFAIDTDPLAYEKLVDRLVDDPAYGENWAAMWLDLARYADSAGYGSDPLRTIWKYRDWVINAFNRNLPYDQFTLDQIAGDLVPNPTTDQLIATAFHRNTKTNTEGGTDDEEFRVEAVRDRVDTTVQVWMGLTMGCAKCHTHKYDPISIQEYYQFYDFFNHTQDEDKPDESPLLATPTDEQKAQIQDLDPLIESLRRKTSSIGDELKPDFAAWIDSVRAPEKNTSLDLSPWSAAGPFFAENFDKVHDKEFVKAGSIDLESPIPQGDMSLTWKRMDDWIDGQIHTFEGDNSATYLYRNINSPTEIYQFVSLGSDDSIQVWINGRRIHNNKTSRGFAPDQDFVGLPLKKGINHLLLKISNGNGGYGFYFQLKEKNAPNDLVELIEKSPEELSAEDQKKIERFYLENTPVLQAERDELAQLNGRKRAIQNSIVKTPVMRELDPEKFRSSHVLIKGNFLSQGEEVQADVPSAFHPLPADAPRNRLGVAYWLTDSRNPLTARVAVNRFWARIFGRGLVETEEDFGSQGKMPTHPALLDWLAYQFQNDLKWDMKRLVKLIVTSSTYRQSSVSSGEKLLQDPKNEWYSRMSRIRLGAEAVRDQALMVSGLLTPKQMGPSVFPPQPDGLWQAAFNGQRNWATSQGGDRYRRGIYTFLRRTAPYPSMATFDAPSREICTIRRIPTNTPLQAFVTMNDPAFVEMSQAFAARILKEGGANMEDRLQFALQSALARPADRRQMDIIRELLDSELKHYSDVPGEADNILGGFKEWIPAGVSTAEAAAWMIIANVILNLDGFLMKG